MEKETYDAPSAEIITLECEQAVLSGSGVYEETGRNPDVDYGGNMWGPVSSRISEERSREF